MHSPSASRQSGRLTPTVAALMLLVGGAGAARAQPVQGDVRSVGFQAAVPSRFVVRHGQWFPILVELTAPGSARREVELRCERVDLDGDRVAYLEPYVVVNPNSVRRVWCYAVSLKESAGQPLDLEVIDRQDGALIATLRAPPFEAISNDTRLILDISAKRVTGLDTLNDDAMQYTAPNWGNRRYYRPTCVGTLPTRDLPDRWYGLEAVDVVVWDEPDPDALPNPAQLLALIEWVRNGGQLVVGIGPAWAKIQKSALADIMPLECTRPPAEVRALGTFLRRYAGAEVEKFKAPISVAVGEPTQDALVTFQDALPGHGSFPLIALRSVGSGRVIATAARLRDLTSAHVKTAFYHELFDLNRNEPDFSTNEGKEVFLNPVPLYQPLIAEIEFQRLATVRVLVAFAFVAGYILIATFGAWVWLRQHTLTHLSWTAFAGLAIAASVLSLGAVGLSRGVTGTVHSVSFIDMEAGSGEARATTYFGYRSNRRQRIDLSLPAEGNYLRPLTTGPEPSAPYATPERYTAVAGESALIDTPMRATLKQFEGSWRGSLKDSIGGDLTIRGELTADRRTGKILTRSWLQNELGVPVVGGYLLYIDPRLRHRPRVDDNVPFRVAGLNTRTDRATWGNQYYGSDTVPPAVNVLAVELPALDPGQRITDLGAKEYAVYDSQRPLWEARPEPDPKREPVLQTLWHRQVELWAGAFSAWGSRVARNHAAALLGSTRGLYLHNDYKPRSPDFSSVGRPVSTAGLIDADVSHWLTRGQAVLLLLAEEPGPVELHLNGRPKATRRGFSIYRVRIPIQYAGRPPTGAGS